MPESTVAAKIGVNWKVYVDTRLDALERATRVSAATLESRLTSMNEFRDTLKDQAGTFATKDKVETAVGVLASRISTLERAQSVAEGKASMGSVVFTAGVAILSLILAIAGLIVTLTGG